MVDKKFSDEMSIVFGREDKLKDKMQVMENDFGKFKAEFTERSNDFLKVIQGVQDVKEELKMELMEQVQEFHNEITIQNERIMELGQKIYSTHLFTERKFKSNEELDVRVRMT